MAVRQGFLIPNANTYAPDFQTSQPDQGDFLILGNGQTGVVAGCLITLAGLTVSLGTGPHIVVVGGEIFLVSGNQNVSIQGKGSQPRWDLVGFDTATGGFGVTPGVPADNPVFPDVTETLVVFAAVYVPITTGNDPHLIDKRSLLQTTLVSASTGAVIQTYNGTDVVFTLDGNGGLSWGTSTTLSQVGAGILQVTSVLQVDTLTAATSVTVDGYESVTARNIGWGPLSARPATPTAGALWIDTASGDITVYVGGSWDSAVSPLPAGMIIMSLEAPADMPGWLPLWGGTYSQGQVGGLWGLHPEWIASSIMTLPDFRYNFPLGTGSGGPSPGSKHGTVAGQVGAASGLIDIDNLPAHSHSTGATTSSDGTHAHTGSTNGGGAIPSGTTNAGGFHYHGINDAGHAHGWQGGIPLAVGLIADTSVDNVFVDDDHKYFASPQPFSTVNETGITIQSGGAHDHIFPPVSTHTHGLSLSGGGHSHTIPAPLEVGGGQEFSVTPPGVSVNFYIKI